MVIQVYNGTANAQVCAQACFVLSITAGKSNEEANVYHGTAATAGNEVLVTGDAELDKDWAPMPGIYCADGIYAKIDKGHAIIQYYLA